MAINEGWDENYGAGRRPGRLEHRVHRPGRQREGHVHLRRGDPRPHDRRRGSDGRPGRPGALSHFGLARKDCLGTARNTTSKVWYTVANGVLSDVYYPTIDNTNVETLQYLVSDGSTFTDLQTRDMTYTAESKPDSAGMACTVTATAKSGKYRIETEYVTDPARNTVLMAVKFLPTTPAAPVRALRRNRQRQRWRGTRERRRRPGDDRRLDRPPGARLIRSSHRDQCSESRLRAAGLLPPSAACSSRPRAASSEARATGSSSSMPTTRSRRPTAEALNGNVVQTARVGLVDEEGRPRARLRRLARRRRSRRPRPRSRPTSARRAPHT